MSSDEVGDPELLRHLPEAQLWMAVIRSGYKSLQAVQRWVAIRAPRAVESARKRSQNGHPDALRKRLEFLLLALERQQWIVEADRRFFTSDDSPLPFVCDVLGFHPEPFRRRASVLIEQTAKACKKLEKELKSKQRDLKGSRR